MFRRSKREKYAKTWKEKCLKVITVCRTILCFSSVGAFIYYGYDIAKGLYLHNSILMQQSYNNFTSFMTQILAFYGILYLTEDSWLKGKKDC